MSYTHSDPFVLLGSQLAQVRDLLRALFDLLGSFSPALDEVAKYYFLQPSNQLRPLIILLLAQVTNGLGKNWKLKHREGAQDLDSPLSRADVLNDFNTSIPTKTSPSAEKCDIHVLPPASSMSQKEWTGVLPAQTRLAQIVEMMHTASLLHNDVIDESPLHRGAPSAPQAYGSKRAILGENFILGRASAALARLGDPEVVELIASVISNLVEGEILQM